MSTHELRVSKCSECGLAQEFTVLRETSALIFSRFRCAIGVNCFVKASVLRVWQRETVYLVLSLLTVTVLKLRGLYLTVNKTVRSVLYVLKRVNCVCGNDRHTVAVY